jgi:hypothetical protein
VTPAERAAMQRRANGAGLLGFLEPAMTVGSGIAAQAITGAAALPTLFMGNDDRSGVDTYVDAQRKMQDSMTYQPRSPEGQEGLLYAADKMAPVGSAIEAGQRYLGDREMNSLPDNAPVWAKAAAGTFGYMIPDLLGVGLGTGPLLRAASNVSRKAGVPEFGADVAPFKKPGFEGELGAVAGKKPVAGGVKANATAAGNYHPVGAGKKLKNTPSEVAVHKTDMEGVEPFKNVSVDSLLGKTIISATGDTTDAGKVLTGIGDVEFDEPVPLLGGFGNQQLGSAFASAGGNLKTIQNRAKAAMEAGSEPVVSYTNMGFGSSNFNTMMSDTTLQMMHSNPAIPKRAKKAFDKELRAISPDWKGIDHPEASAQLRDTTGRLRTDFMKIAGLDKHQDAGFPNLTDVRMAITAPSMLNAPDYHSGHNMSATDAQIDPNPKFNHPTYDTHLNQTEYLGGLDKPLPMEMMFPDFFKQAAEKGLARPKRAFELSKPSQLVTPELVDIWGEAMEPYKTSEALGMPHGGQRGGMSEPLPGAPSRPNIPKYGPTTIGRNRDIDFALDNFAKTVEHPINKPDKYVPLDKQFAGETGREFEAMEADWDSPKVKDSYKSLIGDIGKQYDEAIKSGIKPYFIDGDNPYQSSPSLSLLDMANNRRLGIYPTKDGFGSDDGVDVSKNPMLGESPYKIDGQPMLWNDVFRFVHDAYGHGGTGVGFRAAGEDNAYISHFGSVSPGSRLALANETRGQNTALNYGEHGEHNRTANQDDTIFQDQKAGLLSNKAIYGNVNKAFDEPIVLKGGLLADDPRLEGAINDEGLLSMKHFANQELDSIDPAKYGSGLAGRTRSEKNRSYHPDFLDRSYFGIDADENPYRREAGLGSIEHESTIAPEHIYDADKDPEGLLAGPEDFTTREKAIFESGYSGFLTNHPQHGKVAIVFDKLEAKRLKESGFAHPIMLAAQGAAGAAVMYYAGED